jgi:hypothetical protein
MKKIIVKLFSAVSLVFAGINLQAQQFSNGELSVTKPSQVINENYIPVTLSKEIIDEAMANSFDVHNPYTYLQIVNDATANRYHILFQTNFSGKILYLAYSNNLSAIFNKKDKPMFLFTRCLKEINNFISPIQVIEAVLKCMIDRLNYCYDN